MNKLCECGCGGEVTNEKSRFIKGHNRNGCDVSNQTRLKLTIANTGKKCSENVKLKLSNLLKGRKTSSGTLGKHHTEETKLKLSLINLGKKRSEETKSKLSQFNKGKTYNLGNKHSNETKEKISQSMKGKNLGQKRSEETKSKMSISAIKRMERQVFNGGPMIPCIGNNEIPIINQIQTELNEEILRNNHDISMKVGKFPDGYISKYNLCIEVLEPHHFKSNGELSDKDQKRELRIASKLGCIIYYIPEQEFLSNPDKEIERFKNFIGLLEIQLN